MRMSLDLYSTALVWYGHRGIAKLHGRQCALLEVPQVAAVRLVAIDYRPEIGERRLQPFDGPFRDMLDSEIESADALLRAMLG